MEKHLQLYGNGGGEWPANHNLSALQPSSPRYQAFEGTLLNLQHQTDYEVNTTPTHGSEESSS